MHNPCTLSQKFVKRGPWDILLFDRFRHHLNRHLHKTTSQRLFSFFPIKARRPWSFPLQLKRASKRKEIGSIKKPANFQQPVKGRLQHFGQPELSHKFSPLCQSNQSLKSCFLLPKIMLSFSIIMPLLSANSYITWQFNENVCFHSKPLVLKNFQQER